jgi:hypothetical protein
MLRAHNQIGGHLVYRSRSFRFAQWSSPAFCNAALHSVALPAFGVQFAAVVHCRRHAPFQGTSKDLYNARACYGRIITTCTLGTAVLAVAVGASVTNVA